MPTAQQFGCAHCLASDAEAAFVHSRELNELARLVDESHLLIAIRACTSCGQRFVYTFTEMIDWIDGDDPQRCALLPITLAETDQLIAMGHEVAEATVQSLAHGRPVLVMDFPKSGTKSFQYITGGSVIGPHD